MQTFTRRLSAFVAVAAPLAFLLVEVAGNRIP